MAENERERQQYQRRMDREVLAYRLRNDLNMDGTLTEADSMRDFTGADLEGADLYGADLRGVILRDANLVGANLKQANLEGADLYGADLNYAIFEVDVLREFNTPRYERVLNFTNALNIASIEWQTSRGEIYHAGDYDAPNWAVNYPGFRAAVVRDIAARAERGRLLVAALEAAWDEAHPEEAARREDLRVRNQLYREREIARQELETAARAQEWDARAVEEVLPNAREISEEIEASRGHVKELAVEEGVSLDAGVRCPS